MIDHASRSRRGARALLAGLWVSAAVWCGAQSGDAPTVTLDDSRTIEENFPGLDDPQWMDERLRDGFGDDSSFRPGAPIVISSAERDTLEARAEFMIGSARFVREDYDGAREAFLRALAHDPDNPAIRVALAEAELEDGNGTRAIEICEKVLASSPQYLEAWMLKGRAEDAEGLRVEAVASYERAYEIHPSNKRVLEMLGTLYFNARRTEESIRIFERLVSIEPGNLRGLLYLAFSQNMERNVEKALYYVDEAISYYPRHAGSHEVKLDILASAGRWEAFEAAVRHAAITCADEAKFLLRYNTFLLRTKWDPTRAHADDGKFRASPQQAQVAEAMLRDAASPLLTAHSDMVAAYARQFVPHYEAFARAWPSSPRPRIHLARFYAYQDQLDDAVAAYREALPLGADAGEVAYRIGEIEVARNRLAAALAAFTESRDAAPLRADTYIAAGRLLERSGEFDRAREWYDQGFAIAPNSADLAAALGRILWRTDDAERAISVLNDALTLLGERADFYFELGRAFLRVDRDDLGRTNLARAVALDPEDFSYRLAYVQAELTSGTEEAAREAFEDTLREFPVVSSPVAAQHLLGVSLRSGREEWALELAEQLVATKEIPPQTMALAIGQVARSVRNPDLVPDVRHAADRVVEMFVRAEQPLVRAEMFAAFGQKQRAVESYRQALESRRVDTLQLYARIVTLLEESGALGEALRAAEEAIAEVPPSAAPTAAALRVRVLARMGRDGEAEEAARTAIATYGASAEAYRQLADAFHAADALALAEQFYRLALELDPEDPLTLNNLGYMFAEHDMKLDEAEDLVHRALEHQPDAPFILDSLGWVHYRLGNFRRAVQYLDAAAAWSVFDPTLFDHLGDAYLGMGDARRAVEYWEQAHRLDPDDEAIAAKLAAQRQNAQDTP